MEVLAIVSLLLMLGWAVGMYASLGVLLFLTVLQLAWATYRWWPRGHGHPVDGMITVYGSIMCLIFSISMWGVFYFTAHDYTSWLGGLHTFLLR